MIETETPSMDHRIAARLKALRAERGYSLDDLAARSGVSRATLSRLENAEVSPTTGALARLCAAYGITLSRLMLMAEDAAVPVVRRADQPVFTDTDLGFTRRVVSPPATALAGEVVECTLRPGARIAYDGPPRPGLEHHLVMLEGRLRVTIHGEAHDLAPGDCLRYRLHADSCFETGDDTAARYILFLV